MRKPPFTASEVKKAVKKLKNNKAAGIDEIKAEQLKHGPDIVITEIANILNECADINYSLRRTMVELKITRKKYLQS